MAEPRVLRFYLDDGLRADAAAGRHNFIARITSVLKASGYRVEYRGNSRIQRLASSNRRGYAMFHMDDPYHDRALTMRRVYHYPFWAIESSAERWDWRVARARFNPAAIDRKAADRFYRFWQTRLFGEGPARATRDGFVYVPLQSQLLRKRSFQHCAPLDMLRHLLRQDRTRRVVATLHPNVPYDAAERASLETLARDESRFTLSDMPMTECLSACDYVVTQNSAVAFSGYLFGKPAVLFGRIDFHHIAANVTDMGVADALAAGPKLTPDYAGYVHWFWQIMSINAGHPDADDHIRAALSRAGWPI